MSPKYGKPTSPSSLLSYTNGCQMKFKWDSDPETKKTSGSSAMTMGSSQHKALEIHVKDRIAGKPGITSLEQCQELTDHYAEEFNVWGQPDLETDEDLDLAKTRHRRMTEVLFDKVMPSIVDPQASEERYDATIETYEGRVVDLVGYIDLIDRCPVTGEYRIRDLKTSAKWTPEFYEKSIQFPFYVILAATNGFKTDQVQVDHIRATKTKAEYQSLNFRRGPAHIRQVVLLIEAFHQGIDAGIYTPNPFSWQCSPRCPYWDQCDYHSPEV